MKVTLEIPGALFRRAKSKAAELGMPLPQFVSEAIEAKIKTLSSPEEKPWMKHVGKLRGLRKETKRINKLIEAAFENVDLA